VATQFTGNTIDWVPASPAFRVVVERDGGVVWSLRSVTGVLPPLTYGVTPPTAQVDVPASGLAATDDVVQLTFDSVTAGGIAVSGTSSARRE
jgi:hypothetical protein